MSFYVFIENFEIQAISKQPIRLRMKNAKNFPLGFDIRGAWSSAVAARAGLD